MNDYNNLDFLRERQLTSIPIHFTKTRVNESDMYYGSEKMLSWIKSKLKGRFSMVRTPMISNSDKLKTEFIVAFEDPKEMTFFILGCPHIRRN